MTLSWLMHFQYKNHCIYYVTRSTWFHYSFGHYCLNLYQTIFQKKNGQMPRSFLDLLSRENIFTEFTILRKKRGFTNRLGHIMDYSEFPIIHTLAGWYSVFWLVWTSSAQHTAFPFFAKSGAFHNTLITRAWATSFFFSACNFSLHQNPIQ